MSDAMPEPSRPWAKITETPQQFLITGVTTKPGKFGRPDVILELDGANHVQCQMTVWGGNYNYLYNTLGNDRSKWLLRKVNVMLDAGQRKLWLAE